MCMYSVERMTVTKSEQAQLRAERKRSRGIANIIGFMSSFVPFAYEQWEASLFQKIMFYRRTAPKKYIGYCECGAEVQLTSARSSRTVVCPECNKKVRLTKSKYDAITQEDYFALLQHADGGWIQRLFVTRKESYLKEGKVYTRIKRTEEERDYFDGEDIRYFHPTRDGRWLTGTGRKHGMSWTGWRICDKPLNTYPENLGSLFAGSKYRYSELKTAAEHSLVNPFHYLREYDKEPRLEMIYKLGLYTLGQQLLYHGYDRNDTKRLFCNIKSVKDLGLYGKDDIAECRNMTLQEIIARKEIKTWNLPKERQTLAIAFVKELNDRSGDDFDYSFMTRKQWFKYYTTQSSAYTTAGMFIRDYTDYISDCIFLGYDLTDPQIIMPKRLDAAHARGISAAKYKRAEQCKRNFCTQIQKWLKKNYTDGKYAIAVIQTPSDLVREAQAMHNCSAGYADRIADGRCSIWTIRRCDAPTEAFYMLELSDDGRVVQCRGVATNSGYGGQPNATPEVQAFVNKWRRKKILPMLAKSQDSIIAM